MIILFDLDDTLLENPMERFLPGYLFSLGQYLSEFIHPNDLPAAILNGTDRMVENLDPTKTLEECFDGYFYPLLGIQKKLVEDKISEFYKHEFPKLSPLTNEIPQAADVIQSLVKNNHQIVIATNPLFPRIAIEHRINWANLGQSLENFSFVTNFEELHFTKPHPEFIAEILGKLGWQEEPVVMIGNEWEMDNIPAEKLGLPTFFIGTPPIKSNHKINPLSSSGSIDHIPSWIEKILSNHPKLELKGTKVALIALLRATAANLDSFGRDNSILRCFSTRPNNKEWALIEIVSHLADVDEEVNIPRLNMIRKNKSVFIEAAITDHWAEERIYLKNDPLTEIKRFISNRVTLIDMIENLSDELWNHSINHAIFGPTPTSELIKFISQHDRIHINQIAKTLDIISDR